jgi:5-methylcytosine-specific restriction endonuclease McrA
MKGYSFSHLTDPALLQGLAAQLTHHRGSTATLLAYLAEVDERRLYVPAGYPSMYLYCVHELHMSEGTAFKRIRAARTARQLPAIYPALAEGRLHLSAVVMLTPHLSADTADVLLAAAEHKTKAEIELLLARRFPQPDLPTLVGAISPQVAVDQPVARPVEGTEEFRQLTPGSVATIVEGTAPMLMAPLSSRVRIAPLSPGRYALQVTVDQETHQLLRYVQALLGHALPSGEVAAVLKRALEIASRQLERQKFAKSVRTRPRRGSANGRYVPAEVRRMVWQRDGGQCTFVSESGKRCGSTTRLEFDHVDPVARGGQTTVDRMRLRCRSHNQYEAECTFGTEFMRGKREEARCRTAQARAQAQERASAQERTQAVAEPTIELDVRPWLRQLGFSAEEARRGAALCADIPDAPIEERVRVALRGLAPNCAHRAAPVASSPA